MGAMKQYDPAKVIVIVGPIMVSGFADGTFISAEKNVDTFSLVVGAGGEATRVRSQNNSGKVTLTLLQTSETNALLAAMHEADRLLPAGAGVVPILIKDVFGTTVVGATKAWISKPPKVEFGKDTGTREWTIESNDIEIFAGGN